MMSMLLGLSFSALGQTECDTILPDFSSNSPRCTGGAVDFVYTQPAYGGDVAFLWDFGSGATPATSIAQNPTGIVYSKPGLKLVTLTVEITIGATLCTKVKTDGVSIVETPSPDVSFVDNQCEEAAFNFSYTGTTGTGWTYTWDFGSGATPAVSSAQNPNGVKYTGGGAKTMTLTVSNGSCAGIFDTIVNVLNKPDAGFSVVSPACTGDAVSFTNTGTSGAGVSFDWDFGAGATPGSVSGVESPNNVIYSSSGSKNIQQIVTQSGCTDTIVKSLNVTETPAPSFAIVPTTCEGAPVNFSYDGSTGTGWTYSWDFGTGSNPSVSSALNPLGVLYIGAGLKAVSLTATNQNCSQILIKE